MNGIRFCASIFVMATTTLYATPAKLELVCKSDNPIVLGNPSSIWSFIASDKENDLVLAKWDGKGEWIKHKEVRVATPFPLFWVSPEGVVFYSTSLKLSQEYLAFQKDNEEKLKAILVRELEKIGKQDVINILHHDGFNAAMRTMEEAELEGATLFTPVMRTLSKEMMKLEQFYEGKKYQQHIYRVFESEPVLFCDLYEVAHKAYAKNTPSIINATGKSTLWFIGHIQPDSMEMAIKKMDDSKISDVVGVKDNFEYLRISPDGVVYCFNRGKPTNEKAQALVLEKLVQGSWKKVLTAQLPIRGQILDCCIESAQDFALIINKGNGLLELVRWKNNKFISCGTLDEEKFGWSRRRPISEPAKIQIVSGKLFVTGDGELYQLIDDEPTQKSTATKQVPAQTKK